MLKQEHDKILYAMLDKYKLTTNEKDELLNIINFIYMHDEFQRRMTDEFYHHDRITLGEHILEDTIISYILVKKHKKEHINLDTTCKIAMLHDLYTIPWQNNPDGKEKKFLNMHGFRHPIEAVINAVTWYPEIFELEDAKKIIDGVVHHMFPFPVLAYEDRDDNPLELKNFEAVKNLDEVTKNILIESSNRGKIGRITFVPSMYSEGNIVSIADKMTSINNFKGSSLSAVSALVTGKNRSLKQRK